MSVPLSMCRRVGKIVILPFARDITHKKTAAMSWPKDTALLSGCFPARLPLCSWNTSTRSCPCQLLPVVLHASKLAAESCVYVVQQKMYSIPILICTLAIVHHSSAQQAPASTIFGLTATPTPSATTTASAYTTSATIFLPSALFDPDQAPQVFTGQVATTDGTTYYSLTYDLGSSFFNPSNVPHTVAAFGDRYVFSASAGGTNYVVPQ